MTAKAKGTHPKLGAPRVPIDLASLGPKMRALPSDRWRAAAVARFMVKGGIRGKNTAAVRAAGFGNSSGTTTPNSMKNIAFRVFHDARMLEALHELGEQYLKQGVPDAIAVVQEIMVNPRQRGADRLKAAQIFIDRHHPVQTTHHVTVEHVDDRRMVDFALKLATELGIEAQKLIGRIDGQLIEQGPKQ
jgi:hypothetical protein